MSGAFVQIRAQVTSAGVPTVTDTITGVTAGNLILVHLGCDSGGGSIDISGVSDGTAYTVADVARYDATNGQFGKAYFLPNAGAGTHVVVATANFATPSNMIMTVMEISGLLTAAVLDQATGQAQPSATTAANNVSSGATAATTNANDFIVGLTQNDGEATPGTSVITAGTGFAKGGTNNYMAVESKSVSSTGAQTATFTQSVATARITHVLAFKESGGGGGATISVTEDPRRPRPGRGPYSLGQYFRPSIDALFTAPTSNTIAVPKASITLDARIPVVIATANNVIAVPVASITLDGKVPVVLSTANNLISVPLATISLNAFAPVISNGTNQTIQPPLATMSLNAFAPTIVQSSNNQISVPLATISMNGFAPTVTATANNLIAVPKGALSLNAFAPTVAVSGPQVISVPLATIVMIGYPPTVLSQQNYQAYGGKPGGRGGHAYLRGSR